MSIFSSSRRFQSLKEIDELYASHIKTAQEAGIEFNLDAITNEWNDAKAEFRILNGLK